MIKTISDEYVYKKEVDWSLFNYGFAIPIEHQVVFSQVAGRFIQRGESKDVNLYLNGKSYKAKLNNNRIDKKFGPHADIVQIRYTQNSDLAQALRGCFQRSYAYISKMKQLQEKGLKKHIPLPDNYKEYLSLQCDSALRNVVRIYPYDIAPGIDTTGDGKIFKLSL